jgi:hypothetical protein
MAALWTRDGICDCTVIFSLSAGSCELCPICHWKTVAFSWICDHAVAMDIDDVEFRPDAVVFDKYPFPGARVHPSGSVPWSEVVEVDPEAAPPELRVAGETLFISATHKDELRRAAEAHGVPIVSRYDVWDLLLEPFLDTTFDDETGTLELLERNGVSAEEVRRIRDAVGKRVLAYNSVLWDWVHLGMYDLFLAHRPNAVTRLVGADGEFRELYRWAQEIAQRAIVKDPCRPAADA